ncbi:flagellar basal-body rod protein FlgF [Thiohalorhabdus methylotrophus]|uniref:Flagellar basal-body rod protein FlgF n=1 Tax=Thiohalorhabdus methylotrophus TaxID=3242694 RepID=A0ABV4TVY8_9GAMM
MLEGSIFTALSGALSLRRRLDTVANNLSNVSTTGFKANRLNFDGVLSEAGKSRQSGPNDQILFPVIKEGFTDHSQGALKKTDRKLDFALQGAGFFRVQTEDGEAYTRDGRFHLNPDGTLVDVDGRPVLNDNGAPIELSARDVEVNEAGELFVPGSQAPVDRLGVVRAADPQQLEHRGDNLYTSRAGNMQPAENARVTNEHLEGSNVNTMEEMVHMLDLQRSFQSITKAMKSIDEAYSRNAADLASPGR